MKSIHIFCPRYSGGVINASKDLQCYLESLSFDVELIVGWPNIFIWLVKNAIKKRNDICIFSLESVYLAFFFKNSIFWLHGFPNKLDMKYFHHLSVSFYYKFGFKFCRSIVAVSEMVKEISLMLFGKADIFVSHNFYIRKKVKRLGSTNKVLKMVYLSRLISKKGILKVVDCLALEHKVHLDIFGDGPLLKELKSKIIDMKNVTYMGLIDRDKLLNLIGQYDIHILPSTLEPCAMSVCETSNFGCFQLISKYSGAAEIVSAYNNFDISMDQTESLRAIKVAINVVKRGYVQEINPKNQWIECLALMR